LQRVSLDLRTTAAAAIQEESDKTMVKQGVCDLCGYRGQLPSPGPEDRRWCPSRFCAGTMTETEEIPLARDPIEVQVRSSMVDGELQVIARFGKNLPVDLDPRAALERICDWVLVEAQALDLLGFREGGDLLRRAVEKIREERA